MTKDIERRSNSMNDILIKLGEHEEAITTLKSARLTDQHFMIGQHAIISDRLGKQDDRIEKIMEGIEIKMEHWLAPITEAIAYQGKKLESLTKFQWTIVIGGGVIGTMVAGGTWMAWQILTNHDKLSWIWR